jgi:hypothetical protein
VRGVYLRGGRSGDVGWEEEGSIMSGEDGESDLFDLFVAVSFVVIVAGVFIVVFVERNTPLAERTSSSCSSS